MQEALQEVLAGDLLARKLPDFLNRLVVFFDSVVNFSQKLGI